MINLTIMRVFYSIIISLINIFLYKYTFELEKMDCECSDNWMRDYIKHFSLLIPIMFVLILFFGNFVNNYFITRFILLAYNLALTVYTFIVISYYSKLRKCLCSNDWRKTLLLYPLILLIPLVLAIMINSAKIKK